MHPTIKHAPDLANPGWWTWDLADDTRYNATIGKLIVQPDGPGRARCRIVPGHPQSNLGDALHGGAILTFIDMAFFAGGHMAGLSDTDAVTLECTTQFIGAGALDVPLDIEIELIRETGRLAFLRGLVVQAGGTIASFSGTLRKIRSR